MQPGFGPAHRQGDKRRAASRDGLETPAELPHRLDPSLANDAQPFQDRANLGRDRPALACPKRQPSPLQKCQILKRPSPCEIGTNAQDEMDMVAHDGITADIDREDRGKLLEPLADPFLAVLVIMSGFDVEPTKERPANASRDAMIDPNLVGRHDLRARVSWHRDATPLAETRSGGR